jgi:hypothetical protein
VTKLTVRRGLAAVVLFVLLAVPLSAFAAGGVTFTLNRKSAFAHVTTDMASQRAASLFLGQTYAVTGRTADSLWVRLDYAGLHTEAWMQTAFGTISGDLSSVPVTVPAVLNPAALGGPPAATPAPDASGAVVTGTLATPLPAGAYFPTDLPVIPAISQTARDIYQRGLTLGNNPKAFSKIGDCQSVVPYFLASFDYGNYALGPYAALQETIDQFSGSWARESIATNRGFNVATVFVPLWADPKRCLRNESPLACELRINHPSFAIITMETWWGGDASGYESYLRRIVEYNIARGTVPILGTKADNIEGNGSLNGVIVKLAQEYDVPLWNFWAAVQPLPNHGLHPDGFHLTWERNYYDNAANLSLAWPIRNLTALQAIEAVWRGVTAP